MKLINNDIRPQVLEDGTVLAASGTDGYIKEVKGISERDRKRLADRGIVAIEEKPGKAPKEAKE
jgi:hypothetical protein